MPSTDNYRPVRLFYSYCHEDSAFRDELETTLGLLKREGVLDDWFDHLIVPGQRITTETKGHLEQSDIVVFLFSRHFIASRACMEEWDLAKDLEADGKSMLRIPIIIRDCAWLDILENDDVKALPKDAKAVATYVHVDVAWQEIYDGIKAAVQHIQSWFMPRPNFLEEIQRTEFSSGHDIGLQDLYTFLTLTRQDLRSDMTLRTEEITDVRDLLSVKHALIHGQEKTGKTALAKHLYLHLVDQGQPVIFMDISRAGRRRPDRQIRNAYEEQFFGDYAQWSKQSNRTLILDNLSEEPSSLGIVSYACDHFDRVFVTVPSDTFYAYFKDERRLRDFQHFQIQPLTLSQQEQLIRKRLAILESDERPVTDGMIDQVENQVNSIVISNKIVPRYPFYILSILQTHESDMPVNMSITSYGHCYYVLIIASLVRAGISRSDHAINACVNFAEQLSFAIYQGRTGSTAHPMDMSTFEQSYKRRFIIEDSIISRLKHPEYGVLTHDGDFRSEYMYYYFLARYLATHLEETRPIIHRLCEESHRQENHLTLIFTIHHLPDNTIIDEILEHTRTKLIDVSPATLEPSETGRFRDLVGSMPSNILSKKSVEQSRQEARSQQGEWEYLDTESNGDTQERVEAVNDVFRVLKNNKILSQVLRNKYSNIERSKVEEIIEVVADSGLRLVNLMLIDEDEMSKLAVHIATQRPEWDMDRIKRGLEFLSFMWTLIHVQEIVSSINIPQIKEAVNDVVNRKNTAAFDLIGYFNHLESIESLIERDRNVLRRLWGKHDDTFFQCVISLRTQSYINTHKVRARDAQSICSILGVPYVQKLRPAQL